MNKIFALCFIACLFGCNTIKKWQDNNYIKISSKKLLVFNDSLSDCHVRLYKEQKNNKPLNGNYLIYYDKNFFEYSTFSNGLYEGKKYVFFNNVKTEEIQFSNGIQNGLSVRVNSINSELKDSTNYKYGMVDGEHTYYSGAYPRQKSIYKSGVKNGKEYLYDETGGVFNVLTYELDTTYTKSDYIDDYFGLYFKDAPFMGRLNVSIAKPDIKYTHPSHFVNAVSHSLHCDFKGIYLISIEEVSYIAYCTSSGCKLFTAEKLH